MSKIEFTYPCERVGTDSFIVALSRDSHSTAGKSLCNRGDILLDEEWAGEYKILEIDQTTNFLNVCTIHAPSLAHIFNFRLLYKYAIKE